MTEHKRKVFDPVKARAIGERRLEQAGRRFGRRHGFDWNADRTWVLTKKQGVPMGRTWLEVGTRLRDIGQLVRTTKGWVDGVRGDVLVPVGGTRRAS